MRRILSVFILILSVFLSLSVGQNLPDIGITATLALGEVIAVDAANKQISLKTKDGEIAVVLNDATEFKRVSPDKPTDLSAAVASALTDIGAGDRIIAQGRTSDDKKTISTRRVILMTKSDIAKKQASDAERWQTRGIVGRVTAMNPAANEITVALRATGGMGGERTISVVADNKTSFRRYAPNSVRFSDARASNFNELKIGDTVRALGDKTADGARMTAEEVVSGSFKMVAGKITAVDAAKGEVTIKDMQTDKPVTIVVGSDTLLRKFPAEMAQRMAQMQAMRAAGQMPAGAQTGGQGAPANPGMARPNPNGGQPGQGMGQGGGMRGGDVDQMLERMPALTLAELKVGDAVAASSTVSTMPDRVQAIKFVAGIEPFLNVPQMPQQQGRPQAAPQINIPGLDGGFGAP